jgi:hypothetical protein
VQVFIASDGLYRISLLGGYYETRPDSPQTDRFKTGEDWVIGPSSSGISGVGNIVYPK